jgi:CheY-like chemotaxis protein
MISVLAVDDNSIHCYAISKILQRRGFSVATANSGNDALQVVALKKPDVVLLDINLPDLSGFEVCQRLRADPTTRDIAVVFHTAATANEVTRQHASQVGGDAFLTYPVDQEHLYSVIQGCVAKHHRQPS